MSNAALSHPTDQALRDFSVGKLGDALANSINRHLQECPDCQQRVVAMPSDSFLCRLRAAHVQPDGSRPRMSETGAPRPTKGETSRRRLQTNTLPPDLADHPDYEILRELGRGGMGVVYLAHNRLMGRDEVLKIVGKHLIERKGVLERFSREIRSAARLTHPNIVHAYSAFRSVESVVFAMEYVEGLDLAKLVNAKGPMSVAHASYFAYQAALGLQHAHEQGLVHRDIKPGNLMLSHKGDKLVVKVLDFGLAKATRENPLDGALTHEGQMLGTPDFIAPEQIRDAQSAGIQADIYSLGCTLYYLLTGAAPFHGPCLYDLLQAHFSMNALPLNLVRPEVPAELAALVGKMMAKDMNRRFQTPAEVAEALKPFFKKAVATSKPDVSMLGISVPRQESVQATPAMAESAKRMAQQGTKPANEPSSLSGSQLPPVAELMEPESAGGGPQAEPARGSKSRPPWKSLPHIAAAGAFSVIMLAIIIIIISKNGRMTVVSEQGNTTVVVGQTADGVGRATDNVSTPGEPRASKPAESPAKPPPDGAALTATSGFGGAPSAAGDRAAGDPNAAPSGGQRADGAPPAPASDPKPPPVVANSIGMKLALIPAGEFMMGSPDPNATPNERPEHKVRISTPFYMGVTEVTQAQYEAVTGSNPSYFSPKGEGKDKVAGQPHGEYPVEQVSWLDSVLFCNGLSKKEGLAPYYQVNGEDVKTGDRKGPGYRLPTEAEWEYACRGGKSGPFSAGPDSLAEYGWFRANSNGSTHPVGKKRPNKFGLYDMAANVWEWCSDEYGEEYYKKSPEVDPPGPSGLSTRVRRGGSGWRSPMRASWWSNRGGVVPNGLDLVTGFRVARLQSTIAISGNPRVTPVAADASHAAATAAKDAANTALAKPPLPPIDENSPEGVLRKHGLTRSGAHFVVASEPELIERAQKVRPLIDQMAKAFGEYAIVLRNEVLLREAEEYRANLTTQIDAANANLSNMPNGARASSADNDAYQAARGIRDGLNRERDVTDREMERLRTQQIPAARKEELAKIFMTKRTDFIKASDELRPSYEKAMAEYRKLHSDLVIKDALSTLDRSTKAAAILGPSKDFQRGFDRIKEAVRAYSTETAAPKKKGRPAKR